MRVILVVRLIVAVIEAADEYDGVLKTFCAVNSLNLHSISVGFDLKFLHEGEFFFPSSIDFFLLFFFDLNLFFFNNRLFSFSFLFFFFFWFNQIF